MAYARMDHPIAWELTHHPVVAVVVAIVVAAALFTILTIGPGIPPPDTAGIPQVP